MQSKKEQDVFSAVAWVASSIEEENWLGKEVDPKQFQTNILREQPERDLNLPPEWFDNFPTGRDIFKFIVQQLPKKDKKESIDKLLLRRRELEFEVFEEIEEAEVLPNISHGFKKVEDFIKYAHSVSNRRKSRTGRSLELNLEALFLDEKIDFETQVVTENRKKPDFLFPSSKTYHDVNFPSEELQMMAIKTCCKDRWRQILNEAGKVRSKHLFTLQQGVSANQLKEMKDNHVELVVPAPLNEVSPSKSSHKNQYLKRPL